MLCTSHSIIGSDLRPNCLSRVLGCLNCFGAAKPTETKLEGKKLPYFTPILRACYVQKNGMPILFKANDRYFSLYADNKKTAPSLCAKYKDEDKYYVISDGSITSIQAENKDDLISITNISFLEKINSFIKTIESFNGFSSDNVECTLKFRDGINELKLKKTADMIICTNKGNQPLMKYLIKKLIRLQNNEGLTFSKIFSSYTITRKISAY